MNSCEPRARLCDPLSITMYPAFKHAERDQPFSGTEHAEMSAYCGEGYYYYRSLE